MKEHPILFSGPMVRAILEGRKTMTRRVIRPQPDGRHCRLDFEDGILKESSRVCGCWNVGRTYKCPFGVPGDRLWVRETWVEINGEIVFAADYQTSRPFSDCKYKPSIHMPKKYARIWLEVVSVRVERVQEITEADCMSEGVWKSGRYYHSTMHPIKGTPQCWISGRQAFEKLWDSINEKRGYGWNVNPWIWVVEFKLCN